MKIIHTSDWHIGQSFFGYDRKKEHEVFFDWLKKVVAEHEVDVLLVAGDVFDSPNPSAESQRIYYRFLRELTAESPCLQIVITAGNHDSAARLEAPDSLLEGMNIHVRGLVAKDESGNIDCKRLLVPLVKDGSVLAWCLAVPYLRQGDYPNADTYARGVKELYELLYAEAKSVKEERQAVIAMGHLQATGSEVSEGDRSERSVVGGLECITPDIFDKGDVVYAALGHLHKAQKVSGREYVRYAGSPLPMSFAEKHYKQGVNLITLERNALKSIERLEFQPPAGMISLPKVPMPLSEVLNEIESLPDGEAGFYSPYLELKVLLTEPEPSMRSRIEDALQGKSVRLAHAVSYRVNREEGRNTVSYEELKALSPLEMAGDVYCNRFGSRMPDRMRSLLQQVIEEVRR